MNHYCTYFDSRYLLRGMALYRSLKTHESEPFIYWVLCLDEAAYQTLTQLQLPDIRPVRREDFERGDESLVATKQNRSAIEYIFTCTPSWLLYVFRTDPTADKVIYVDSDLFFFQSGDAIFEELGVGSIYIIPHRYPAGHDDKFGIYNVGLLVFRRDEAALACLQWWRERCIEWCYDYWEDGKFADQGYLNEFPQRFRGVVISQHVGVNTAPWNWINYHFRSVNQQVMVDEVPLIFYHFQGVKILSRWLIDPLYEYYYGAMDTQTFRLIYQHYFVCLRETHVWLKQRLPNLQIQFSGITSRSYQRIGFLKRLLRGRIKLIIPPL